LWCRCPEKSVLSQFVFDTTSGVSTANLYSMFRYLIHINVLYTVKKAERDAGPKHEGEGNSIIHVERSEKSVNTRDWASLFIRVTEFSVSQARQQIIKKSQGTEYGALN
jgi:hypothetical protein